MNNCGNCNLQETCQAGNNGIEILCAYNHKWHKDNTSACNKWIPHNPNASTQDRIKLSDSIHQEERDDKSLDISSKALEEARKANAISSDFLKETRLARNITIWATIITILLTIINIFISIKNNN